MDFDNGFARAQRSYENQMPDEDEEDANMATYNIEGSVIDTPYHREKLKSIDAYDIEVVGDNDSGQDVISFSVTMDKDDITAVTKDYEHTLSVLKSIDADIDTDEFTDIWEESEPDYDDIDD